MRYLLALLLMVTGCQAATPSFSSFNTNQFSTNNLFISIKDGASVTNIYNTRVNPSLPNSVAVLGDLLWRDVASIATLTNSMEGAEISHNVANGDDDDVYFDIYSTVDGTFQDFSDIFMIVNTNSTQISLTTDAGGVLKSSLRLNSGDGSGFIQLQTNGTNEFYVANGSGYTGAGTLFLSDDGTYKAGGTTINPTDNYIPYRSNATTFADSVITYSPVSGLVTINHTNDITFISSGGAIDVTAYTTVGNNFSGKRLQLRSSVDATASVQENSQSLIWASNGWSTNSAISESVLFSAFNQPTSGNLHPTGTLFIQSQIDGLAAATNFSLVTSSGWTGAGTLFLADDGTYKAGTGLGTTINPTDGYLPYRSNATTFGDSPWYVSALTNAAIDSQIIFGPGTTNVLYRDSVSLLYTNANASGYGYRLTDPVGTAKVTYGVTSGGNAQILVESTKAINLSPNAAATGSIIVNSAAIVPDTDNVFDLGSTASNGAFKNSYFKGAHFLEGSNDGGGNYTRLSITHAGNAANVVLDSQSGGTQTTRPIVVRRAGSDRQVTATAAKTLTESSATIVVNIAVASGKISGGVLRYTINADDATDFQSRNGVAVWSAVNKAGTVTASITDGTTDVAASAGTLTVTWTAVANGNSVDLKANAVSSLTQTTLEAYYEMDLRGTGTLTVTP